MFHRINTEGARPIDELLADDQVRRIIERGQLDEELRQASRRLRAAERRAGDMFQRRYARHYRTSFDDVRRCRLPLMRELRAKHLLGMYRASVDAVCRRSTVDVRRLLREAGRA